MEGGVLILILIASCDTAAVHSLLTDRGQSTTPVVVSPVPCMQELQAARKDAGGWVDRGWTRGWLGGWCQWHRALCIESSPLFFMVLSSCVLCCVLSDFFLNNNSGVVFVPGKNGPERPMAFKAMGRTRFRSPAHRGRSPHIVAERFFVLSKQKNRSATLPQHALQVIAA